MIRGGGEHEYHGDFDRDDACRLRRAATGPQPARGRDSANRHDRGGYDQVRPVLEGGTLTLTQGELQLTQDVTIDGDADNNGSRVTLSGGWSGTGERTVAGLCGSRAHRLTWRMRDLTLTHGSAGYSGRWEWWGGARGGRQLGHGRTAS